MKRSESITNLTKSLAVFHSLVGKISKDAKNPFFKSNYASLPHILTEIQEPMEKAGLVITQFPDENGLTTILIHSESGEYLEATYIMPVAKANDPQALGSAISYARRYAITSILNLKIEDDDAEKAMSRKNEELKVDNSLPWLNPGTENWKNVIIALKGNYTISDIEKKYRISKENKEKLLNEASQ